MNERAQGICLALNRRDEVTALEMLEGASPSDPLTADLQGPLHVAARFGCARVVRYLLHRGAGVDAKTRSGMTALMMAAGGGHDEVVQVLVGHGADVHVCNDFGFSALAVARENGRASVVSVLALIGMLLCFGCSSGTGVSEADAAHHLVGALQGITDLACGECARCEGDRCDECLLQINTRLGNAMTEAVGPLGHGRKIDEIMSFDELALPDDAKAAIAKSEAKLDVCYEAVRKRK